MKAFKIKAYGAPEKVLELSDIPVSQPLENEVLVKVMAAAINDYDWSLVTGKPRIYRLMFGISKPKNALLGMELAGVVEAVGKGVHNFKPGDRVIGDTSEHGFGALAEYMSVNEKALSKLPDTVSFSVGCALPHAALLALQGLEGLGQLQRKMKVLINGAGGGVGAISIQLTKLYNCHTTGVDTAEKFAQMKALGYDELIDYRTTDFSKQEEKYDLILDCRSKRSPFSYLRALKPGGRFVTVGGDLTVLLRILIWRKIIHLFTKKRLHILSLKPNQGINRILDLVQQKKITPLIDGPYPFDELPKQLQRFGDAVHHGKIVIEL